MIKIYFIYFWFKISIYKQIVSHNINKMILYIIYFIINSIINSI